MKGCRVEIARASRSAGEPECLTLALQAFFGLFIEDSRIGDSPLNLIPEDSKKKRLAVVPSTHESTLDEIMEELLVSAYGKHERAIQIGSGHTRLLFVRLHNATPRFEHLAQIYRKIGIAEVVELAQLSSVPESVWLAGDSQDRPKIGAITCQKQLQEVIETSSFPSGAAEIQECLFRNRELLHAVSGILKSASNTARGSPQTSSVEFHQGETPSVRLLFGAFTAGNLGRNKFLQVLRKLGATLDAISKKKWRQQICKVSAWAKAVDARRVTYRLDLHQLDNLPTYLSGRRILLIEDQLSEQHWDVALPAIFGLRGVLSRRKRLSGKGKPTLFHAETVDDALRRYGDILDSFDIILLDLFSSEARLSKTQKSKGALLSTIGASIGRLVDALAGLRDMKAVRLEPFPQLVAFSYQGDGTTIRTILQDFGAADYFIKGAEGEPHKAEFYSSLRNCIINALTRTCMHVTGHAHVNHKESRFSLWLRQFSPQHRPMVLNLMKHFRYYSAQGIVNLFNRYLQAKHTIDRRSKSLRLTLDNLRIERAFAHKVWFSYLGRATKSGPATLSLLSKLEWLRDMSVEATELLKTVQTARRAATLRQISEFMPQFKSYDDLCKSFVGKLRDGEVSDLILVDDVIGSGGQIDSYLRKWINRDLLKAFWREFVVRYPACNPKGTMGDPDKGKLWQVFLKEWQSVIQMLAGETREKRVRITVVFAVGPENTRLRRLIGSSTRRPAASMTGSITIPVCLKPIRLVGVGKKPEDCHPTEWDVQAGHKRKKCACGAEIILQVHVIEVSQNYAQACANSRIRHRDIKKILWDYVGITNPRPKEFRCNFEPFGWKDGGGLIATYANTPGNTLPIVWGERGTPPWRPLWPRFFNPWDDGGSEGLKCCCGRRGRQRICESAAKECVQ